jgi:hypothetical protein
MLPILPLPLSLFIVQRKGRINLPNQRVLLLGSLLLALHSLLVAHSTVN